MKIICRIHISLCCCLLLSLVSEAQQRTVPSLTADLLEGEIWKKDLETFKKSHDPKVKGKKRASSPEGGLERFEWLSKEKNGLRAPGKTFTLLNKPIGEIVARGSEGKILGVSISIYNRGDDDLKKTHEYKALLEEWTELLDTKLETRFRTKSGASIVPTEGFFWKKDDITYLLEGSQNKKNSRAEFIRLRIAPAGDFGKVAKKASRSVIKKNVVKKENGDVMIEGVPMVDQGQKGYCVCASVERVARYFGLTVDQHELAQLAETDQRGTSPDAMEAAFKKMTGKIHVRTNRVIDYDYDQTEKDFKAYNREAKKQGAKVIDIDLDAYWINAQGFWMQADKEVFKTIKEKQSGYKLFNRKIQENIERGIPICWTLQLGMFPEKGLPQSFGGHMRLITGYNKQTQEIVYTDSWGMGHAEKRMSAAEAWCMTLGLYAMIPLN